MESDIVIHTENGDYELKYTYNALCAYEEKFGSSLIRDQRKDGFSAVRSMIWAGLLHVQQPDGTRISVEQAGQIIEQAIIDGTDVVALRGEATQALNDAVFIRRLVELTAERTSRKRKQQEK